METFKALWDRIGAEAGHAKTAERVRLFLDGDHWQAGQGWGGPLGDTNDRKGLRAMIRDVKRVFTCENVIREIVDRQSHALAGRDPDWQLIPAGLADDQAAELAEADRTAIDSIDAALIDWYDTRKILAMLKQVAASAAATGAAYMRLFVPSQFLDLVQDENGRQVPQFPAMNKLADALALVCVDTIPDGDAATWIDPQNKQPHGAWRYIEVINGVKHERIELSRVRLFGRDPETKRLIRLQRPITDIFVFGAADDGSLKVLESAEMDLGGHVLVARVQPSAPLIDEPMLGQQVALNTAITMGQHNLLGAGLTERALINANWPKDSSGKAAPYQTGLGTVHLINGLPIYAGGPIGGQNPTGYTQPSIWTHEPSDPSTFNMVAYQRRTSMLRSAGQLFALLSGDAMASGEARTQALADFMIKIKDMGGELQALIRWLLGAALALAAQAMPEAERARLIDLRVNATIRYTMPPASSESRQVDLNSYEKGVLSTHEVLIRDNIDDPDAEIARRNAEDAERAQAASSGLAANLLAATEAANAGIGSASITIPPSSQRSAGGGE